MCLRLGRGLGHTHRHIRRLSLSQSIRAGLITTATALAFNAVGDITGHRPDFGSPEHVANIAGHAAVGCLSARASGGDCASGAAGAAAGAFAEPLVRGIFPNPQGNAGDFMGGLMLTAGLGGAGSKMAGGKFEDGAVTASFGYLFNQVVQYVETDKKDPDPFAMTTTFQKRFAGSAMEESVLSTMKQIEYGKIDMHESFARGDQGATLLPTLRRDEFYSVYKVIGIDGTIGTGRLAHIYGTKDYYYSPNHYKPLPDVPSAWIKFQYTSRWSIICPWCK